MRLFVLLLLLAVVWALPKHLKRKVGYKPSLHSANGLASVESWKKDLTADEHARLIQLESDIYTAKGTEATNEAKKKHTHAALHILSAKQKHHAAAQLHARHRHRVLARTRDSPAFANLPSDVSSKFTADGDNYIVSRGWLTSDLNFRLNGDNHWEWSPDNSNFMPVTSVVVSGGSYDGQSPTKENIEFINLLGSIDQGLSNLDVRKYDEVKWYWRGFLSVNMPGGRWLEPGAGSSTGAAADASAASTGSNGDGSNGGDDSNNGGDASNNGGDASNNGGDASNNGGDASNNGGDATDNGGDTSNGGDGSGNGEFLETEATTTTRDGTCAGLVGPHEFVGDLPRLPLVNLLGGNCFRTDSRDYSQEWTARGRFNLKMIMNGDGVTITPTVTDDAGESVVSPYSDYSKTIQCDDTPQCGSDKCKDRSPATDLHIENLECYDGSGWSSSCDANSKLATFHIWGDPGDPCTPPGTPGVDFYGSFTVGVDGHNYGAGAVDEYPWYECGVVTSAGGHESWHLDPLPGKGPFDLFGPANRPFQFSDSF